MAIVNVTGADVIVRAILNGEVDESLDQIAEALGHRRKVKREADTLINKLVFIPGTRVRLKKISPKYLNGLTGTVQAGATKRAKDLPVLLDEGQYTGRFARRVNVPASSLEKVE